MPALREACNQFQVKALYAFGSILTQKFLSESDLDFAVVFDREGPAGAYEQYFGFKERLEEIFGREVDLVTYNSIQNPFFKEEVDRTKKALYVA